MNMNPMQTPNFGMPMSVGQMQGGVGTSPNLSGSDLSSVFGGEVQSSGGLMVQFFYHRVRLGGRNTPNAGKFETRLAVALKPRGDMRASGSNSRCTWTPRHAAPRCTNCRARRSP